LLLVRRAYAKTNMPSVAVRSEAEEQF